MLGNLLWAGAEIAHGQEHVWKLLLNRQLIVQEWETQMPHGKIKKFFWEMVHVSVSPAMLHPSLLPVAPGQEYACLLVALRSGSPVWPAIDIKAEDRTTGEMLPRDASSWWWMLSLLFELTALTFWLQIIGFWASCHGQFWKILPHWAGGLCAWLFSTVLSPGAPGGQDGVCVSLLLSWFCLVPPRGPSITWW